MITAPPKLETQNLSVAYDRKQALFRVSLTFPRGGITALLGPSGCGKSTLLFSLNRLHDLEPNAKVSGKVLLDGQDVYHPDVDPLILRRRVGLIFQKPNPFPFSIEENISFALKEHRVPKRELGDRVQAALIQAALWDEVKDRLKKPALQLSGGQQQRLCIARAIALQPEVLLLDEPCASLDPISTTKIEELLLTLKGRYTLIIVTHNLAQAQRISEHAAFFWCKEDGGHLIEAGETRAFFENPMTREARDYLRGKVG
jgi:phosphate transport system ATP-binding protein